jgi:fido (protein-threonine AMPylation protein)
MLGYALDPFLRLVYGSNMIESAGNSFDITRKLCAPVFQGQGFLVSADIDKGAVDYAEHVRHLRSTNRPTGHSEVVQSRREIIQHAQALLYTILQVVQCRQPWSEGFILTAHRILHAGLDDHVELGAYRTHEVAVKYEKAGQKTKAHLCMRARAVSGYMKDLVEHPNHDAAAHDETRDPPTLAARYHHQFVNIHPFGDGNGRMSRIIVNLLLLRHAGPPCVSVFGVEEEERDAYIAIATRAARVSHAEDTEVFFDDHTGHLELAGFIKGCAVEEGKGGSGGNLSWHSWSRSLTCELHYADNWNDTSCTLIHTLSSGRVRATYYSWQAQPRPVPLSVPGCARLPRWLPLFFPNCTLDSMLGPA